MVGPRQSFHDRARRKPTADHSGWVRSCHRRVVPLRRQQLHFASEYFPQRCSMVDPRQCFRRWAKRGRPADHCGWLRSCHRHLDFLQRRLHQCASEYFPQRCGMVDPRQCLRRRANRKHPAGHCGWVGSSHRRMARFRQHELHCASEYFSQRCSMVGARRSFHRRARLIQPAGQCGWVGSCYRRMDPFRRQQPYCAGEYFRQRCCMVDSRRSFYRRAHRIPPADHCGWFRSCHSRMGALRRQQ